MQPAPALEQEFLPLRAKLLEIGAALDRLDRGGLLGEREPRVVKIRAAIETLLRSDGDRAEQIQLVFSRTYEEDWREKFRMTKE
jgi:hypothetical protein